MAIPESVKATALEHVEAFCERVPPEHRDEVRIDYAVRGNAITVVERRPPWHPGLDPEWTSMKIAQLRYDQESGTWTLYCCDRHERWFLYDGVEPSREVTPLLAEIDEDPTGIFWG